MSDKQSATQVQPNEGRSLKARFNLTDANMFRGSTTQSLAAVEVHPIANLFPPMPEVEFNEYLAGLSYSPEQVVENWFPKPPLPSEEAAGVQLELELVT
jgi:hypothetical protein